MKNNEKNVAQVLLNTKAVTLNANEPFTFASGIKSPIYCDNRKVIGFVEERNQIIAALVDALKDKDFDVIAGTATAGIPWASFLAHALNKPMCYIRSQSKQHGTGKQIEGADIKDKKVILIEDLISTGSSCINAAKAALDAGCKNIEVIAIFSYGFNSAIENFQQVNITWSSLSNFNVLVDEAQILGYLKEEDIEIVKQWNKNPHEWKNS